MARYAFPSSQSHSPHSGYQQPIVYTTSNASHHGGYYSTPSRRHNSFNGHATPQVYGVSNSTHHSPSTHGHSGTQYLVIPDQRSRSRTRSSHGHGHGRSHSQSRHHGHGHSASVSSHPSVVYATPTAPVYLDTGHHRSHRHPSQSSHHSHHSNSHSHHSHSHSPHHSHSNSNSYGTNYYQGHQRTPSLGDRVRRMFGFDQSHPSHHTTSYGDAGRRRHNSFSGYRDDSSRPRRNSTTRTGLWCFGPTENRRYVNEHGQEVDRAGRIVHRM